MSIILTSWGGRSDNNVIELLNIIKYAEILHYRNIIFPKHELFTDTEIIINNQCSYNDISYQTVNMKISPNNAFYFRFPHKISGYNRIEEKKEVFIKYLLPIFKVKDSGRFGWLNSDDVLLIHIQSGDIFNAHPHPKYIQPPLAYYKYIIKTGSYRKVYILSEDRKNPCINELLNMPNTEHIGSTLLDDIECCICSKNIVFGFGTFANMIYYASKNMTNMYIPSYYEPFLGLHDGTIIQTIDIPDYIKVGDWKNTPEQCKLMLDYEFPTI